MRLDKIECFRKGNVGIIFEVSETNEFELLSQWMLRLFLRSQKPMNLKCFHYDRKAMLGLFPKSWKPVNLNCFRNEWKPMLGLFLKSRKPMNLNYLQWANANVGIVLEVSKTNEFELFLQWSKANVRIVSEVLKTNEFKLPL